MYLHASVALRKGLFVVLPVAISCFIVIGFIVTGLMFCVGLVYQIFKDYFCIFKDKCAPGLEWALHNPPKPHAFSSFL